MKANQFSKTEEAVSPVIGVILMVAITVVLAAVVFVLVSNLSDTKDQAPDIGFAKTESTDIISVISTDSGLNWEHFRIVTDQTAEYSLNGAAGVATGQPTMAAATVAAGDAIKICGSAEPINIRIVHVETNTQVYETDLTTLGTADC